MIRALFLVLCLIVPSLAGEVDVYLLAGQSNMQGIARLADLPARDLSPVQGVMFWNGKEFEPLTPGKTRSSANEGEFGPELAFAHAIPSPKRPVFLIKYSASGMPLDPGWNSGVWLGGRKPGRVNFFPGNDRADPNHGRLYAEMIARFGEGLAFLSQQGHTPVVRGLLWMQGEQDAKHEESANHYPANLKLLRHRISEDLHVADLPMAFGQVLPYAPTLPRFVARDLIRRQMTACDMSSGSPLAIPHCRMVPTDTFPVGTDTVHYVAKGQWLLGMALGKALGEAMTSR
ncbi:MAG: sialate O-acetylesterase [Luteolibacter sp.]